MFLERSSMTKATDPRDMVYGLLNLSEEAKDPLFAPDYSCKGLSHVQVLTGGIKAGSTLYIDLRDRINLRNTKQTCTITCLFCFVRQCALTTALQKIRSYFIHTSRGNYCQEASFKSFYTLQELGRLGPWSLFHRGCQTGLP